MKIIKNFILLLSISILAICPIYSQESTNGEIIDFPYTEDFNSYTTTGEFPSNWYRPVTYTSGNKTWPAVLKAGSYSNSSCLEFKSESASPTYAVMPKIGEEIRDLKIEFDLMKRESLSGTISVGLMSDPNDITTFEEISVLEPKKANNWEAQTVSFANANTQGSGNHIAFKDNSMGTFKVNYIDNIKLTYISIAPENCGLIETPFLEDFNNNSETRDCWTILDLNEDASLGSEGEIIGKWYFDAEGKACHFKNADHNANDWLISPKLKIKSGQKLSFDYKSMFAGINEKFSVWVIKEDTQNYENAISLLPTQTVFTFEDFTISPISLSEYSGHDIYIGIKCESENRSCLEIDNFAITGCPTITTPFTETFDDNSLTRLCWLIKDVNNDANHTYGKWQFDDNMAKYIYNQQNSANDWLISPKVAISANDYLCFNYLAHLGGIVKSEKFSVYVIREEQDNISNATEILATQTVTNQFFQNISPISLNEYSGQEIYIGIKCESAANMSSLHIDDFIITSTLPEMFKITASTADANGTIDPEGEISVIKGSNRSFKIKSKENFKLDKIFVDGEAIDNNQLVNGFYTIKNIEKDYSIKATFKPSKYKIEVIPSENGSISPGDTFFVQIDSDQEFVIKPNPKYKIKDFIVNEISLINDLSIKNDGSSTYTLSQIQENKKISASFETIVPHFTISAASGPNGSISPIGDSIVEQGSDMNFLIKADELYEIKTVHLDETDITNQVKANNGVYTLLNIQKNHKIVALFKIDEEAHKEFNVSAKVKDNIGGTIMPSNSKVQKGKDIELTILPAANYIMDELFDNGQKVSIQENDNKYKIENIKDHHEVIVSFKLAKAIEEQTYHQIKVFPNPSKNWIFIESSEKIKSIQIVSILGEIIFAADVNSYKYEYETKNLTKGNYLIKINTDNNQTHTKMVIIE